jgi:phi13 family phage major tail protein
MPNTNKITYGLSNVHVWPITATTSDGIPTYGSIIEVPGAKEVTLSAEGETVKFYADNIIYWTAAANNGYSGDLTIADVPAEFAENILKEIRDVNGVMVEDASTTGAEFAMAFEFEGDVNKKRHVFYRCTAGRPEVSSKTKEENIEPNTQEVAINAIPRLDNHFVKATVEDSTSAAYEEWYGTAPYEPTLTATPVVNPDPEGEENNG